MKTNTVYVAAQWVKDALDGKVPGYEKALIAEVTYDGKAEGSKTYSQGHVPGAIMVADTDVEDADGTVERPYNILPAAELEKNLLHRGITKDTRVILYGDDISGVGRVAFGLLYAGVDDVKILNGGIKSWTDAGFATEKQANEPAKVASFGAAIPVHPEYLTSMADARKALEADDNFKLVSIRSKDEFLGKTSGYNYINRAGEPKGAVWRKGCDSAYDVNGFTNDDGTVKDLEGLKKEWEGLDFSLNNHLAFYCGTGWRATIPFLVLYENDFQDISLYDGGWYEWQLHDDNPVQVGDPASQDVEYTTVGRLPEDKAAKE